MVWRTSVEVMSVFDDFEGGTVGRCGSKGSNSGTKRRHKEAPPLVGESELKPYRIGYDRDLIL
jgi:hypothetical protein